MEICGKSRLIILLLYKKIMRNMNHLNSKSSDMCILSNKDKQDLKKCM